MTFGPYGASFGRLLRFLTTAFQISTILVLLVNMMIVLYEARSEQESPCFYILPRALRTSCLKEILFCLIPNKLAAVAHTAKHAASFFPLTKDANADARTVWGSCSMQDAA